MQQLQAKLGHAGHSMTHMWHKSTDASRKAQPGMRGGLHANFISIIPARGHADEAVEGRCRVGVGVGVQHELQQGQHSTLLDSLDGQEQQHSVLQTQCT